MSRVLFKLYSSVVTGLVSKGYSSIKQKPLLDRVLEDDFDGFFEALDQFTNDEIAEFRQSDGLNNFEKLIGVWKKKDIRKRNDIDYKVLLYFANVSDDSSSINKQETILAYSYLIHFKNVRTLYFLHINPISTTSLKQLTNKRIIPEGYSIKIMSALSFNIDITQHFYVPRHELIENKEEFYKKEGFVRGSLPKININDPAIVHLNANVGDVIKIERNPTIFGGIKTLYFREITSSTHPIGK